MPLNLPGSLKFFIYIYIYNYLKLEMSFVSFQKKHSEMSQKHMNPQIGYSFILFATLHGQNVSVLSQNVWIKYTSLQKQPKTHALEGQKPCAYQCLITF